jgi:hypothetical protein
MAGGAVSRLVFEPRQDGDESVLVLGGEDGLVSLHFAWGLPQFMVMHSPREIPGWDGPMPCSQMELPCWRLDSIAGDELRASLSAQEAAGDESALRSVMELCYRLYLERAR